MATLASMMTPSPKKQGQYTIKDGSICNKNLAFNIRGRGINKNKEEQNYWATGEISYGTYNLDDKSINNMIYLLRMDMREGQGGGFCSQILTEALNKAKQLLIE